MADKVAQKIISGAGKAGVFLNKEGELISKDAVIAAPTMNRQVHLQDDFLGDVIADQWSAAKGINAQAVVATIVAGSVNGVVRLTSGNTVTVAESLSSLTQGLQWRASDGGLTLEVSFLPVTDVADVSYFVGFTDVLATSTLEEPVTLSGNTFTTNATDAVGFVYDTGATTDVWYGKGVKNGTDSSTVTTESAPTVSTAQTLKIEIDSDGIAYFYIDGVGVGSIADAVTTTVALTPIICVMARATTSKSVDIDYIDVKKDRF